MAENKNEPVGTEPAADSADMESKIKEAMRSRVDHFKEQSDSLTFEGVRRLLEKDLGLQEFALDVHKRFVRQCLLECLDGAGGDNVSKDSGDNDEKIKVSVKTEAFVEVKNETGEQHRSDDDKMEDSPVMGLLTGKKAPKSETEETVVEQDNKEAISESSIKEALVKRASYVKANSDKVTMAGLRRLLEEDLKIDKFALDPYKKFISTHLDEVLESTEVSESKKKTVKKVSQEKASKKSRKEASSDSSDRETDKDVEKEVKPKKKPGPKKHMQNSEGPKKRKRVEKETKVTDKKRIKPVEKSAEDSSSGEDDGNASEDSRSQSSDEKPVKKKEAPTPVYGKKVEHLKSIIKSCGMSVAPVVYKRVKQVPENKREAQLIKELEKILSEEGLSSNPSEKEIKDVRKKKERAKELEGIDMSNIVSTTRRRSMRSYVPPPEPKELVENDSDNNEDGSDDNDNDDDEDDDDDEEAENDEEDDGDNDGDADSQSEELNGENAEDSE